MGASRHAGHGDRDERGLAVVGAVHRAIREGVDAEEVGVRRVGEGAVDADVHDNVPACGYVSSSAEAAFGVVVQHRTARSTASLPCRSPRRAAATTVALALRPPPTRSLASMPAAPWPGALRLRARSYRLKVPAAGRRPQHVVRLAGGQHHARLVFREGQPVAVFRDDRQAAVVELRHVRAQARVEQAQQRHLAGRARVDGGHRIIRVRLAVDEEQRRPVVDRARRTAGGVPVRCRRSRPGAAPWSISL